MPLHETAPQPAAGPLRRGAPAVIGALAVLLYAAGVSAPLHPEIGELLAKEAAQDVTRAPDLIGEAPVRALPLLTLAANWELTPASRGGFRLVQITFHGVNAVLLFFVLARLLPGRNAPAFALAAALLFTAHPAASEAVMNSLGRGALIGSTFMLAALWCFLRCVEDPGRWVCKIGLVAALAAALGLTLAAAALPPVLLALDAALAGRRGLEKRRGLHGVMGSVAIAVLVAQWASGFPPIHWPGAAALGGAMGHSAIALFTGLDILVYHSSRFTPFEIGLGWSVFAALLTGALALSLAGRRIGAGLLWLSLTMALTALAPLGQTATDYRLYIPLAGLALVIAPALMALDDRIHSRGEAPPGTVTRPLHTALFGLALLLLTGACAAYSLSRVLLWGDPAALWSQAADAAPGVPYPAMRRAEALVANERYDEAGAQLRELLEADGGTAQAWRLLGDALLGQGLAPQALEAYQEALWRNPRLAEAAMSAGMLLHEEARASQERNTFARAAEYFQRAAALDGRLPPEAYAAYARTLAALGKWRAADAVFARAANRSPTEDFARERALAAKNLERIATLQERLAESEDAGSPDALRLRAELLTLQGRPVAAAYTLDEVLRAQPGDPAARRLREQLRAPL